MFILIRTATLLCLVVLYPTLAQAEETKLDARPSITPDLRLSLITPDYTLVVLESPIHGRQNNKQCQ